MENQAEAHRESDAALSSLVSNKTKSAHPVRVDPAEGQSSGCLQASGLLQDVCECVCECRRALGRELRPCLYYHTCAANGL